MILRYQHLSRHQRIFLSMTGLRLCEFDPLFSDVLPLLEAAHHGARQSRQERKRAVGAGHPFELDWRDQVLLCVVWLRQYPTQEVLGYLFGVSDTTVLRAIQRVLPVLEQSGKDTMRLPDPGKKRRRQLEDLLQGTPDLAVLIDSFEQRVQRPKNENKEPGPAGEQAQSRKDTYYSGKKKQHTLKSQVAVDETTGKVVDVSQSVAGPTADLTLLEASGLLRRLPSGVGGVADLAYLGAAVLHPQALFATPRRKPRGKERPPEDVAYNRALSRRRIVVEHTIGRLRRYQALSQVDRHRRRGHTARVRAVAGLVNRMLDHRLAA
jgi:DDE superfamily endonuclease/Helix-turn-helix of DDE superfamily endonuclease